VDHEKKGITLLFEAHTNFNPHMDSEVKKIKFSYFLQYLKPVYGKLAIIFTLILLIASFNFLYPYINQQLIDKGVKDKSVYFIIYFLAAQLITYTSSMIMEFIQGWIFLTVKVRFGLKLVNDFLIKLMKMPISFFENKLSSDILLRIADHDKIENFFSQHTMQFIISVLSFFIFSIVLIQYSNMIFLVFFTGSIISVLWVLWFHKVRKFLNYKKFELESLNRNILYEVVNGISDIKINNFEVKKVKEWRDTQQELVEVNKKNLRLSNTQEFGINYLTQIKNTIILGLAAFMVIEDSITLGTMLAISFIIGQLNAPLEHFVLFIYSLQDAKISLERLIDVYEKKDEEDISGGSINEVSAHGDIILRM
jgi:ATP-binding cassette subfamily B protein